MGTFHPKTVLGTCLLAAMLAIGVSVGCGESEPSLAEGEFVDGQKHGLWKEWFPDGTQYSEGTYKEGKEEGTWRWWYETGKLQSVVEYRNGEQHGEEIVYYRNGQMRKRSYYAFGKRQGLMSEWDDKGVLKNEVEYQAGLPIQSYPGGKPETVLQLIVNLKLAELLGLDRDRLVSEVQRMASEQGCGFEERPMQLAVTVENREQARGIENHEFADTDGEMIAVKKFSEFQEVRVSKLPSPPENGDRPRRPEDSPAPAPGDGSENDPSEEPTAEGTPDGDSGSNGGNGLWSSSHPDGTKASEGMLKDGKEQGLWQTWHPNGQLQSEKNYSGGVLHGKTTTWYANGKMERQVHYENGQRQGTSLLWDEQGGLLMEREYRNGELVDAYRGGRPKTVVQVSVELEFAELLGFDPQQLTDDLRRFADAHPGCSLRAGEKELVLTVTDGRQVKGILAHEITNSAGKAYPLGELAESEERPLDETEPPPESPSEPPPVSEDPAAGDGG